jgi:hypothetical protein
MRLRDQLIRQKFHGGGLVREPHFMPTPGLDALRGQAQCRLVEVQ